jgi:hypothetical protein
VEFQGTDGLNKGNAQENDLVDFEQPCGLFSKGWFALALNLAGS